MNCSLLLVAVVVMMVVVVVELLDVGDYYLIYWQLICPTGRWFWLWRRDLPKPVSLANAWVPTTAAVAHHIFTTLMTPTHKHTHTYTDTHIHKHWSSSHFTRSQKTLQLCHPGCMQNICNKTSLSAYPFSNAKGCSFISSLSFSKIETHLLCSAALISMIYSLILYYGARVRANQTL